MIRILFWILVAAGLACFFVFIFHLKKSTADEQVLFLGIVVIGIMAILAAFALFMFVYCWKKRVAIMIGRYGNRTGRTWSRDSQPFRYWSIMLFYAVSFVFVSYALYIGVKDLLLSYSKVMANH
jgi:hypothetical protein